MTKTKAQMRKEVVERLKGINSYSTVGDILCAVCGKPDCRTWDATQDRDVLIELLTDECDEQQDSREKLEADIDKYRATDLPTYLRVPHAIVISWLDRQAALTERKWTEYLADATSQIDRLEKERDELQHGVHGWNWRNEAMCEQHKNGQLKEERDDLRKRLADIREIATFPLCLDYNDHEEVDA